MAPDPVAAIKGFDRVLILSGLVEGFCLSESIKSDSWTVRSDLHVLDRVLSGAGRAGPTADRNG